MGDVYAIVLSMEHWWNTLHTHFAGTRRTNGRNLVILQEAMPFRKSGRIGQKSTATY